MKYEVIKEYPGCGQIKKGYIIEYRCKAEYKSLDYRQRTIYIYRVYRESGISDVLEISLDFNPADYPEFFKPIEDKPKWINHTIHFLSESEEGLKPIPIKPRRHDLYTKDDMIEFARFVFKQWSTPDTVFLNEWVSKKLES